MTTERPVSLDLRVGFRQKRFLTDNLHYDPS